MSPVIILGLVLMWAVVLVPMWLRRHDEAEETRSVDRFSAAMHTLSRREAKAPEDRYVVMPRRSRSVEVHVSGASAPRMSQPARRSAAQRRRRTLLVLVAAAIFFLAIAGLTGSLIAWVFEVMLDCALIAFVVHLRRLAQAAASSRRRTPAAARRVVADAPAEPRRSATTAQRQQQRRWEYARTEAGDYSEQVTVRYADSRRVEADYREPGYEPAYVEPASVEAEPPAATAVFDQTALAELDEPAAAFDGFFDQDAVADVSAAAVVETAAPEPVVEPSYARYAGPGFIEAGVVPGRRDTEAEPAARTTEPAVDAPMEMPAVGTSPWEPVPVPRPTYAMKPAAPPRRPRYEPEEPLLPPVEPTADLPADELEEILDRRWAVND